MSLTWQKNKAGKDVRPWRDNRKLISPVVKMERGTLPGRVYTLAEYLEMFPGPVPATWRPGLAEGGLVG